MRELDGELEDTLRALRKVIGLALGLVCCGDGSIFYVAVGGRVLRVGRGLIGFGIIVSLSCSLRANACELTLSMNAIRQWLTPMITHI